MNVRVIVVLALALATSPALFADEVNTCSGVPDSLLAITKAPEPVGFEPSLSINSTYQTADPSTLQVSKRLFGVIPNYRADNYQDKYTPISTAGKFAIARSDSFDWPNYLLLAGYAMQSQIAAGGFHNNGGLNGFGRYYSRSVADQIIGSYVTEAILPTLFHEDPRFFRLGRGPILYRAYYATSRIFVVKKDDGRSGLYLSEIFGNMGVTAIGTIYYSNNRTASASLERYSMALGNDMISNLLTEFWPDIKRKLPLLHKKA